MKPAGQPSDTKVEPFKGAGPANAITFSYRGVQPPASIYIQRDDLLLLVAETSLTTESINLGMRILLPPFGGAPNQPDSTMAGHNAPASDVGNVVPVTRNIACGAPFAVTNTPIQMTEGFLLSASASCQSATTRGQTYVALFVFRGNASSPTPLYCLFSDYVTTFGPTGWPNGRVVSGLEGPGNLKTYQVTNPGAGNEFVFTPSNNSRVRIQSVQAQLVTSAVAGNRAVQMVVRDGANNVCRVSPNQVVAPSITAQVTAAPGLPQGVVVATDVLIALPQPLFISTTAATTMTLRTVTAALDAGDAYTNIFVNVEEWLDAQ